MRDVVVGMLQRPGEALGLERYDLIARRALMRIHLGTIGGATLLELRQNHPRFPASSVCSFLLILRRQPRAGNDTRMPAEFGYDGVAGGDAHVVDTGAAAARNLARLCYEAI